MTSFVRRKRGRYKVASRERRTVDGITFASLAERRAYDAIRASSEVAWFIRQPSFDLVLDGERPLKYRADFLVVWKTGKVSVVDVKGHRTEVYTMKRRLLRERYGIEIEEWR